MKRTASILLWLLIALLGAGAYATLALQRNEPLNSAYILVAALCTYAIGYRFYSKWIAARVLALNDRRATPCEVHDDGKDFVKTNKWIVFGHHFAAISGPGPLVGPVLAAQFGYLPGTLWILIGVVLGGAVQDFIILFASMRRDGKSLAQMVREELNTTAGVIGVVAIISIMIILLAVLALVVVNALAESPWGIFTVAATIPIALFMGGYLRWLRAGKVMEGSIIGVALLLLAVWGGQYIHSHSELAEAFTLNKRAVAWSVIVYALAASVLPVWLLLAPRDYLSTFMKLGTIALLAAGCFIVLPELKMPAVTKFIDGTGLVFSGKLFPFCFITIACGAISGFHTLISSGITPKIITRESYSRPIGYGAMCLESLVAIMAMIAACALEPSVYLSMNTPGPVDATPAVLANVIKPKVDNSGLVAFTTQPGAPGQLALAPVTVSTDEMVRLAETMGEKTLYGRAGGAATLAVGMANIFSGMTRGQWLDLWYHFALMFEALFILTTLDAGTRVGRYLLQDALGHLWKPLGDTRSIFSNVLASGLVVAAWGYFLIAAVIDPDGGIKALWPIFGIANQLLAAVALCLATTVILKMQLAGVTRSKGESPKSKVLSRPVFALVTLVPLLWLLTVTGTAAVQKIWHSDPKVGFLAGAKAAQIKRDELRAGLATTPSAQLAEKNKTIAQLSKQRFNLTLDAAVTAFFLALVTGIFLISGREWILLIARKKLAVLRETEPTWLPDYAVAEAKPLHAASLLALTLALLRELSGEAKVDRIQQQCACAPGKAFRLNVETTQPKQCITRGEAYQRAAEERFEGINRCC